MTSVELPAGPVRFEPAPEQVATAPVEAGGGRRDDARLMVAWRSRPEVEHARFHQLGRFLEAGDVVVVNTSATLAAALPARPEEEVADLPAELLVHLSTELVGGNWVVELRRPCGAGSLPFAGGQVDLALRLPGGGRVELRSPYPERAPAPVRLWTAALRLPAAVPAYLAAFGRPIRYGCSDRPWPLAAYQTVFARHPGSAEMPSAGRAFTPELVTELVAGGVLVVPVVLHTGVSSQDAGEPPYAERYRVPGATAGAVNVARRQGRRVIATGTTVTRALESATDRAGTVHAASGWTELVITPGRGVRVVDGLLTGWHEPNASHLQLLEAVAGPSLVERSYAAALVHGYRWHEFGDLHLVLP
ncbi:MAG TPA: S-adenosylmethionine:tRNA ribosyltransferase-isomerase [Acidimicrobiales bacterium]|nr:S-adenosylmethionine:tRNA ribosyltransferase-isomerase [Acidimicrobiales bacterium]